MQSLPSSNSRKVESSPRKESHGSLRHMLAHPVLIWMMRILVGIVFVTSGFVKGIDPWGSYIKINEYLTVWGWDIPSALITLGAFLLAAYEFVWGMMLMLGCYRRTAVWMLSLMMLFMLPLTLYIAIASPVADCGCFGDFMIISNTATFVKNVLICGALIYLLIFNTRIPGLYAPYAQWTVGGVTTLYILIIQLWGYNIQPMLDFRRFDAGTELLAESGGEDSGEVVYEYIYTKNGAEKAFLIENLPDSTWIFKDRRLMEGSEDISDGFILYDDDTDITAEIIDGDTEQFLITIPDLDTVDPSYTYIINELNDFITTRGGSLAALVDSDEPGIERWRDISMGTYPIVKADPKLMKELARGNAAVVFVDHGRVQWKRTLSSINYTMLTETHPAQLISELDPHGDKWLQYLTLTFITILLVILALDRSGKLIAFHLGHQKKQ